ncbi:MULTISPECIES: hypothetical protein [Streptomonospora]|uniref:Uncharacterized protein n=2 Tax=Streptomonospora TaxID=104204 RepID=A0ABV9SMY0_9ACTN
MSQAVLAPTAPIDAEFAAIAARIEPFSEPDPEQEDQTAPESAPSEKEAETPEKESDK